MRKMRNIWLAVWLAACCALLPAGCHKDDGPSPGGRDVSVLVSVASRVGEETVAPTRDEAKINTLRVYAFVGGEAAGYYYTDNPVVSPDRFLMDLKMFSENTQVVHFYVVANEKAMSGLRLDGKPFSFDANTTEAQLNRVRFPSLDVAYGLPMFCRDTVVLDMGKNAGPAADPAHQGHTRLQQSLEFSLERPIAKLGVYAAKIAGETAGLHVREVRLLKEGVLTRNYLMPQEPATLQGITSAAADMVLKMPDGGVDVTHAIAIEAAPEVRRNPGNYTDLLGEVHYLFENPDGNGGGWSVPGSGKGNVLQIDYDFGGEARTGTVYMPAIQRNHCYNVLCLMNNSGVISVAYTVADWSRDPVWEFDFDYPTYVAPVAPVVEGNYEAVMYVDPVDEEKGAFGVEFTVTAPANVEWTPILPGMVGTDYVVKVYRRGTDGQPELQEPPYGATTDDNPFVIKVIPKDANRIGEKVRFGIAHRPKWLSGAEPQFLLVNSGNLWPGGDDEVIEIEQITTPTN